MDFYAHYDKETGSKQTLSKHLGSVKELVLDAMSKSIKFKDLENKFIKNICIINAVSHDIGKYSEFFQKYLIEDKRFNGKENHSNISALIALNILIKKFNIQDVRKDINIASIIYLA